MEGTAVERERDMFDLILELEAMDWIHIQDSRHKPLNTSIHLGFLNGSSIVAG
jgi:hypothetical protein